jgi:hypothetical protein
MLALTLLALPLLWVGCPFALTAYLIARRGDPTLRDADTSLELRHIAR